MIHPDIHSSLLRFCADFAAAHTPMEVVNFDAYADESSVPQLDIVGISSLSLEVDEHLVNISVLIGLSSLDDTNLMRLTAQTGVLYESLLPTCKIPVYDATTGTQKGLMVVRNGTKLMPVGGNLRPLQYVMVNLACTVTLQLP